jgi:hypothetical protein
MVYISRTATNSQVLEVIFPWIDALAREEYDVVFENLGYAMAYQFKMPGAACIRHVIESYRSRNLYPGEKSFKVTPWKDARGGNKFPSKIVTWYQKNSLGLVGSCTFDLPINGRWSDLSAEFVWFDNENLNEDNILSLEDITFPKMFEEQ